MRLTDIAHLYRVRMKERAVLLQEIFAVIGISVGVALLFASQIASTSLDGSVQKLTQGIVGDSTYQLKARSSQGFDEQVFAEVLRLPGVRSAVPGLEQKINLVGAKATRGVDLLATDPRYVQSAGPLLREFSARQLNTRIVTLVSGSLRSRTGLPDP